MNIKRKLSALGVPMFFVLPLVGFFLSLANFKARSSFVIFILFCSLLGFSISLTDQSADSSRYAEAFLRFDRYLTFSDIVEMYKSGELRDLYRLLLFYITSSFTNNPKILFGLAGLIYGVLCYKTLLVFVNEKRTCQNTLFFILAIIFFTYISPINVNGFRFNTGALLFFLSSYNYLVLSKKKWLFGLISSPFFHYGFLPAIPALLIFSVLNRYFYSKTQNNRFLYVMFVVSFILSWFLKTNSISLDVFGGANLVGGAIGDRLAYVNSSEVTDIVDSRKDSSAFLRFRTYFDYAIKIYVFVTLRYIWKTLKFKGIQDEILYRQLSFVLFFYSFAFVISSFPSGGRFFSIAHLFLLVLLLRYLSYDTGTSYTRIIRWSMVVFLFNVLFINFLLPVLLLSPTIWYGNVFLIIIEGLEFNFL